MSNANFHGEKEQPQLNILTLVIMKLLSFLSKRCQFLLAEVEDGLPERPLVVGQARADVVDRVVGHVSDGTDINILFLSCYFDSYCTFVLSVHGVHGNTARNSLNYTQSGL